MSQPGIMDHSQEYPGHAPLDTLRHELPVAFTAIFGSISSSCRMVVDLHARARLKGFRVRQTDDPHERVR